MVVFHRLKRFYHGVHVSPFLLKGSRTKEHFYRNARGNRILVYHGICKSDPFRYNHLFITASKFEEQLKLFKEYCHCLSLDDFYAGRFSEDRFNVCLTFDDGFANNYDFALPLLEKYKVPAAFFITTIRNAGYGILWNDFLSIFQRTGPPELTFRNKQYIKNRHQQYVHKSTRYLLRDELRQEDFSAKDQLIKTYCSAVSWNRERTYWLQLSEEQIKKMAASPLVTIGSHGFYHNDLATIPAEDACREMYLSRQYLRQLTGREIKAIAFPYGSYSEALIQEAGRIGFTQLLAMDYQSANDHSTILKERMTINPYLTAPQQLYATIKGNYGF